MNIPLPPTHAEVEADRQARASDVVTITDAGRAALRVTGPTQAELRIRMALDDLRDAGWRKQNIWIVLDGRRQWRTVWIAPEGVRT